MKKQEEVPSEKREVIETYRNYRIYKMKGGYEAFASSHHEMVGWMSSKDSGKAIEQLKPTRIERLILPTEDLEEAKRMIDRRKRKVKKPKHDPNSTPKLF